MVQVKADPAIALSMLMDRLSWPVKMTRWRTAKAVRALIEDVSTREVAMNSLMEWLRERHLESEVVSGLSVLLITNRGAIPSFESICANIGRPSILSELLVEKLFAGRHCEGWKEGHSGSPPKGFSPSNYFEEHKTAHIPPLFLRNVEDLEEQFNLPFEYQWAHEWQTLTDHYKITKTGYSNYLGDYGLQRAGIIGQFVQRQGEVYRSAYLRMLSFAVATWGLPSRIAVDNVLKAFSVLPDLFELEPQQRPQWLGKLPNLCLAKRTKLEKIGKQIVAAGRKGNSCLVSLGTPFSADLAEFGDLTMSAFFVSENFAPFEDQEMRPTGDLQIPADLRFNMKRDSIKQVNIFGRSGHAISVCSNAQPLYHGYWHDDYFQRGLLLPASYCFDNETEQRAEKDGLKLLVDGDQVAESSFWHDSWTPLYARENATRCGFVTTMKSSKLDSAAARLGMTVGWNIRIRSTTNENRLGDETTKVQTAFFRQSAK